MPSFGSSRSCIGYALVMVIGFIANAAFADAQPSAQDDTQLTPEKIYLRAIHAMKSAPVPPFVTFRENIVGRNFTMQCSSDGISVTLHHGDVTAAYDVWFRSSDGSAISQPLGIASAKPCPSTLLAPVGDTISSLGVPQASASPGAMPTATSAATSTSPSPGQGPTAAAPDSAVGPPIIAAVHVESARYYHIELAGREQLGGNDVYHLTLKAYRDPDTHPLTDLYVDPETFLVREARGEVSGHYVIASGRLAGVVDFDRVGNYWLVEHERFDIAANALLVHARMTATIDGSNFATPSELPGIVFPTPQPSPSPKATSSATR